MTNVNEINWTTTTLRAITTTILWQQPNLPNREYNFRLENQDLSPKHNDDDGFYWK